MMFAKYFEYYTIILRGAIFCGHAVYWSCMSVYMSVPCHMPTLLHGPGCNFEEW